MPTSQPFFEVQPVLPDGVTFKILGTEKNMNGTRYRSITVGNRQISSCCNIAEHS